MSTPHAVAGGLVGACALTFVHETVRRLVPNAPRLDVLGMRAIAKSMKMAGRRPPGRDRLHDIALAGDIAANSLYFSTVGMGDRDGAVMCGAALGLAAGIGAITLPEPLGLGTVPEKPTAATKAMTIGLYMLGGLVSALAYQLLAPKDREAE